MSTIIATETRRRLYRLLDELQDSHEPVQITGERSVSWMARQGRA